ncbi:MAG: HEAT repeat domain-containing protein, partial [Candidatus Binatia bacterium]|nr:HEAT repeat domain-containing protein [Candidatus Binatia bacterium]
MDLSQLASALLSDDVAARLAALEALERHDAQHPLPPDVSRGLLACLGHTRKAVQREAAAQLVRFARTQPTLVHALRQKLSDPDARVRWTAAFTLSHLDLPEPSPLPVLIENLGHAESDLRWAAATAVVRLAAQHPSVIAAMRDLARDGNAVQRRMALYCLRDLAQTDSAACALYLACLDDPDPMVRLGSLSCLAKLKVAGPEVQEKLLRVLTTDPDSGVRRATAATLGQLRNPAPAVIAALRTAAQSDDSSL